TSDNHYNVTRSVVVKKDVSGKTIRHIVEEAVREAKEESASAQENAETNSEQLIHLTKTELIALIESLEGEIEDLKTANTGSQTTIDGLEAQIATLTTLLEELTEEVEKLKTSQTEETPQTPVEETPIPETVP